MSKVETKVVVNTRGTADAFSLLGNVGNVVFLGESGLLKKDYARELISKCLGGASLDTCPDYYEVTGDGVIGVDHIHELASFSMTVPVVGERKYCLIPDAQRMTPAASDAFLKMMEDSQYTVYVFTSSCVLQDTIMSRSRKLYFECLSKEDFAGVVGDADSPVAKISDGRVGLYFSIKKDKSLCEVAKNICHLTESIKDSRELLDVFGLLKEKDKHNLFLLDKEYVLAFLSYLGKEFYLSGLGESGALYDVYGDRCLQCLSELIQFRVLLQKGNCSKNDFFALVSKLVDLGQ